MIVMEISWLVAMEIFLVMNHSIYIAMKNVSLSIVINPMKIVIKDVLLGRLV